MINPEAVKFRSVGSTFQSRNTLTHGFYVLVDGHELLIGTAHKHGPP